MSFRNVAFKSENSPPDSSEDEEDEVETDRTSEASFYHYQRAVEEIKPWDKFKTTMTEAGSASEKHTEFIKKASVTLKVLTCTLTFLVVLTAGVVSKGATFFMVAQMSQIKTLVYCKDPFNVDKRESWVVHTTQDTVAWLWAIFFVYATPELLVWLRSARIYLMRHNNRPRLAHFIVVLIMETLSSAGVAILFYAALPHIDTPRAIMATNAVCIMPAFHLLFKTPNTSTTWKSIIIRVLTGLSFVFQLTGLIVWPAFNSGWKGTPDDLVQVWALPLGLFLTSFGWWESYVDEESISPISRYLWGVKTVMIEETSRYITYLFVSLWKIVIFFAMFLALTVGLGTVGSINDLFDPFLESWRASGYSIVTNTSSMLNATSHLSPDRVNTSGYTYLPLKVMATQICTGYVMYIFGKFACKVNIQRVAFALPILLTTPVALATALGMCWVRTDDPCAYGGKIPSYIFFDCPTMDASAVIGDAAAWVWLLWFLSQVWITMHIWIPKSRRLASTEQMFGTPYYSGLLLEQSIAMNRRSDSGKRTFRIDVKRTPSSASRVAGLPDEDIYEEIPNDGEVKGSRKISSGKFQSLPGTKPEDEVTRIMGCATMWHENSEEMIEMIKSIFRIDEDYSARFLARKMLNINDPDYYEWETHIFFDDAFEPDDTGRQSQVNQFVRLLVAQVDEQGKKWYGERKMKVPYPLKYPAPYGGRLVWTLPGDTKIICHLKDKNKIRHKKRWSQVMYMYYFLGHRLEDNNSLTSAQKDLRARNTFLLALDGDVDFQPDAIIRLVDLMKRNQGVGAACGRIHPIGSGYMKWYQMFEYAIGHWLQKSTEHVMGCVLCSPGCFSLFRGKALMADNVMKTYTTVATEPRHFVQYDQGEDRWLCTLLLQQGWRVEYSAASDSFTACPEGFKEFYNQRRRWMPSTIANILDLLSDYKRVVRNNDDISIWYIVYQIMMMVGTVLGPGSIFIMLAGSFGAAFGLSNWTSFLINLVPLVIFVVICLTAKSDHQILAAQLLSVAYALVMMAVLIGILIQVANDGWLAPSSLSLAFVALTFIVAGFLHPQELACLPMGIIYYITIPSMYLFLVIYSVFNLNVVSWGTREVPKKKTAEEMEAEQVEAEANAKKKELKQKGTFLGSLFNRNSGLEFSLKNMFNSQESGNKISEDITHLSEKLDRIEMALKKEGYTLPIPPSQQDKPKPKEKPKLSSNSVRIVEPRDLIQRDDMKNPYWIEDEDLGDGDKGKLKKRERRFWDQLILKYLKPLEKDPEKEKQVGTGLKELRDSVVFSFLMINSIWVLTIFLLQENKDLLFVRWPLGPKGPNISFTDTDQTIHLSYEYLQLEPIGLLFVIFFAVVLWVQLLGMLAHRIMTLGHIVATTNIRLTLFGKRRKFNVDELVDKKGVDMVKNMIRTYKADEKETETTMEQAVENTLKALATGDDKEIRRVSDTSVLTSGKSALQRKQTVNALRRRATEYGKRKATIKNRDKMPEPIAEDDEDEYRHVPVVRTNTYKDPEGLEERDI